VVRKGDSVALRVNWCQRWALRYVKLLRVELSLHGTPPKEGLLACNHLSYLDIVVLSATRRQVFLSKAEVRGWPVIGSLAQCAGTLFVRRDRRADVAELQPAFAAVVEAGLPITLFPKEPVRTLESVALLFLNARTGGSLALEGGACVDWIPPRWRQRRR